MSQIEVKRFISEYPQPMSINTCVLDLLSEAGEVAKEVNIATAWGKYVTPKLRPNFKKELAQVLFTVYQLAEITGIDIEAELAQVISDFEDRYTRQGHTGSSDYMEVV